MLVGQEDQRRERAREADHLARRDGEARRRPRLEGREDLERRGGEEPLPRRRQALEAAALLEPQREHGAPRARLQVEQEEDRTDREQDRAAEQLDQDRVAASAMPTADVARTAWIDASVARSPEVARLDEKLAARKCTSSGRAIMKAIRWSRPIKAASTSGDDSWSELRQT